MSFFFLLKISQTAHTHTFSKKSSTDRTSIEAPSSYTSPILPRFLLHMLALKAISPCSARPPAVSSDLKRRIVVTRAKSHVTLLPFPPTPRLTLERATLLDDPPSPPPLLSHEYTDCLSTGLTILRYDRVLPWK